MEVLNAQFKRIYFEYYPVAFRIAYYVLKQKEAAEDVAQEVMLKLWEKRGSLSDIDNLKAYIYRVARNAALDKAEKKKVRLSGIIELTLREESKKQAENGDEAELRNTIEEAVSMLPPKCRLIFSLSRFEGLTNDEIAEYLDISKRTVETQISIALKAFRTDLRHFFKDYIMAIPLATASILLENL